MDCNEKGKNKKQTKKKKLELNVCLTNLHTTPLSYNSNLIFCDLKSMGLDPPLIHAQWRSQTRAHTGLGPGVSVWKTVEHRTFVV